MGKGGKGSLRQRRPGYRNKSTEWQTLYSKAMEPYSIRDGDPLKGFKWERWLDQIYVKKLYKREGIWGDYIYIAESLKKGKKKKLYSVLCGYCHCCRQLSQAPVAAQAWNIPFSL